jgi:hypothetical protein
MPDATIRETIVTPDENGQVVRLQISDVPPPFERATMLLQMTVRLPAYKAPLLAHLERAALLQARDVVNRLLQEKGGEIQVNGIISFDPVPVS